jgi:hypothetical protein
MAACYSIDIPASPIDIPEDLEGDKSRFGPMSGPGMDDGART